MARRRRRLEVLLALGLLGLLGLLVWRGEAAALEDHLAAATMCRSRCFKPNRFLSGHTRPGGFSILALWCRFNCPSCAVA